MIDERFFTVHQIADRLQVTEETVRRWLRAGRLRGQRFGGETSGYRVAQSELERFIHGLPPSS